MKCRIGSSTLEVVEGDITQQHVDAIVNAANSRLAVGGGVDRAIHLAGGPEILAECSRIGGCPTGQAVATTAGQLPAKKVIHAVGPVWRGGDRAEPDQLASCYRQSLARGGEVGARSIAFPAISTGIYGYPLEPAIRVAVSTVRNVLEQSRSSFEEVHFVCFDDDAQLGYERQLG